MSECGADQDCHSVTYADGIGHQNGTEIIDGEAGFRAGHFAAFADGRASFHAGTGNEGGADSSRWQTEYHCSDHLGNIRLISADRNLDGYIQALGGEPSYNPGETLPEGYTEIQEEKHYYPFGMELDDPWRTPQGFFGDDFHGYNGKELVSDVGIDWMPYGARFYDAQLGRFTGVDSLAEAYPYQSPYAYADNNPIKYIDFMGLGSSYNWDSGRYEDEKGNNVSWDAVQDEYGLNGGNGDGDQNSAGIAFRVNFQDSNEPVDINKSLNPIEDILRVAMNQESIGKYKKGKLDFHEIIKDGYSTQSGFGAQYFSKNLKHGEHQFNLYIIGPRLLDEGDGSKVTGLGIKDNLFYFFEERFGRYAGGGSKKVIFHGGFFVAGDGRTGPRPLITISTADQTALLYLNVLYLKYKNKPLPVRP